MEQMIEVTGIKKYYKIAKRDKGLASSMKHLRIFHNSNSLDCG